MEIYWGPPFKELINTFDYRESLLCDGGKCKIERCYVANWSS